MEKPIITQTMTDFTNFGSAIQGGTAYCLSDIAIICLTILIVSLLVFLLIKETAKRNCWGCKRLAKAEKEIEELKKQMSLNGYFDKQTFINLNAKLDKLSNEVHKHE